MQTIVVLITELRISEESGGLIGIKNSWIFWKRQTKNVKVKPEREIPQKIVSKNEELNLITKGRINSFPQGTSVHIHWRF